jgi:uncharacterized protein (TIGR03086 family)
MGRSPCPSAAWPAVIRLSVNADRLGIMTDLRVLHRRALQVTVDVVNQVTPQQLGAPTPCTEWDLGQLLAHMAGQNRGFAASARGERSDASIFAPLPVDDDPAGGHAASAEDVAAAFAEEGVELRELWLPEVRDGGPFPAQTAIGFHLVDCVAHAWDVARAIDVPVSFDDEVLDAALIISLAIPDGPVRLRPGAAFGPGIGIGGQAPTLDRILGLLGRSPQWKP